MNHGGAARDTDELNPVRNPSNLEPRAAAGGVAGDIIAPELSPLPSERRFCVQSWFCGCAALSWVYLVPALAGELKPTLGSPRLTPAAGEEDTTRPDMNVKGKSFFFFANSPF
jgi:hypothetical protein